MSARRLSPTELTLRDLAALAASLDDQIDLMRDRVAATEGQVKMTRDASRPGAPMTVAIDLHGVFASGGDWPEAIRNWQVAARGKIAGVVA